MLAYLCSLQLGTLSFWEPLYFSKWNKFSYSTTVNKCLFPLTLGSSEENQRLQSRCQCDSNVYVVPHLSPVANWRVSSLRTENCASLTTLHNNVRSCRWASGKSSVVCNLITSLQLPVTWFKIPHSFLPLILSTVP
jgi:hypothetical protein